MLRRTKISWADYSGGDLNFVIGCTPVSEGCKNCYAKAWAKRAGRDFDDIQISWEKLNRLWKATWDPSNEFYRRGPGSKPIMFPCDLSDLFHEEIKDELILTTLDIFAARDDADWVLLTKRPERMLGIIDYWLALCELEILPPNIWCLATCENQRWADVRIPILLQVKARVRGVSIEPMLEPVYLKSTWFEFYDPHEVSGRYPCYWPGLNWVIVGAESGPNRGPFEAAWAEDVYDQCQAAGVPFFAKQDSGIRPGAPLLIDGREIKEFPK